MGIGTNIASTVAGSVVRLKEDLADGTMDQYGQGNYIQLKSSSTRFETYYHLTQNGALLAVGDMASAGQHIAESGNTGNSTGAHLHYELDTQLTCADNTCDIDPRAWTTSPGRVPWQTQFYSERTTGVVSGTFYFDQGTTATWWVKFKNTGGRTWTNTNDSNGKTRIVIYATNGASSPTSITNSPFIASDWLANNLPTAMDETSVAPDGVGTFTFNLHSPPSYGSYPHNYFNINAQGIMYLKQTNGSPNQYPYDVPIYVDCTVAPCPLAPVGP